MWEQQTQSRVEWGAGDPLPCQHSSALYGVQGGLRRGVGGQGASGIVAPHGVCKYFNTVPTIEAKVESTSLTYGQSFVKDLCFHILCLWMNKRKNMRLSK